MQGNSRLYCLPEEAFRHPETSAFYLKLRRRNGRVFQTYSLGTEHGGEGDETGSEGGFWSLIHILPMVPAGRGLWPPGWGSPHSVDSPYCDLHTYRT